VVAVGLRGAQAIPAGFAARNAATAEPALSVRVGIAAGEPVDHNDDLFGATVTLAARVCQAAAGGQILVTDRVRDLGVADGFPFSRRKLRALKGFPERVAVYELEREGTP
jgi:class 3 adenylate cyclase